MGLLSNIFRGVFGLGAGDDRQDKAGFHGEKDVAVLRRKIEYDGEYIGNLRLGRSWVLPQMVYMGFNDSNVFKKDSLYLAAVKKMAPQDVWRIMLRNYKVLAENPGAERSRWWTKAVAVRVAEADLAGLRNVIGERIRHQARKNCYGGPYIELDRTGWSRSKRLFFINEPNPASRWNNSNSMTVDMLISKLQGIVSRIENASAPAELYDAVAEYDRNRYDVRPEKYLIWPEEFVDAYAGDGAYCSMMTMVKYMGLCFKDDTGHILSRDECIAEIERKTMECTGLELLDFCDRKFFDRAAGVFDCFKYRKGLYRTPRQ